MNQQRQVSTATLKGVPETLLITLAARMIANRRNPDLRFADPAADTVGAALGFDPGRFAGDKASMRGCIVRGQWFDRVVRSFIDRHENALIVSVGSGLDTRANRLAPPAGTDWIDIDFPEVVALRDVHVPPLPNVRSIAADATDVAGWIDKVDWRRGRSVMMLAEGVSMYLAPERGRMWLRDTVAAAQARESSLMVALDLASPLMVSQSYRHPSVSKTGATFSWGVGRPQELCDDVPGLMLTETYDVARHCGLASSLAALTYKVLTLGRPVYSCGLFRNV